MARRLAAEGFSVLMPNVFYRTGRPPMFDFAANPGDDRTRKRFAELAGPLTPEAVERDAADYVDFLAAHDSVSEGAMGVVGYCFTGSMAMRIAAARLDKIAAAASFHGGGLFTDAPTSPHLVLPRIKARLYFGHAIQDRSMPEERVNCAVGQLAHKSAAAGTVEAWSHSPDNPVGGWYGLKKSLRGQDENEIAKEAHR